jgi:hypothetical protein
MATIHAAIVMANKTKQANMLKFKIKDRNILIILGISLINLLIHVLTNSQYGFHRDELYFIDCAKHLDFGYADMPPLTPFFAKIVIALFGETLQGLRFFPALLSSVIVFITGLMAREMGGKLYSQILASITIIVAPVYLVAGTQFQTIPIDQFFWVLTCYLFIGLINTDNQKLWLLIGFVFGLGLLAKYSIIFLAFAIFFGIIISNHRIMLTKIWIWLGVMIALLVFLPNILWQIHNELPIIEHLKALREDESTPTLQFLIEQLIILHPFNLPIWIIGILFFFFNEQGRKYQMLVWVYIIALMVFLLMKGKSYYLASAYPVLFAGGSVGLEMWLLRKRLNWLKYTVPALLLLSAIIASPIWLPILPVEKMKKLGIADFRYDYREMIGWPELVSSVAKVYNGLQKDERMNTIIITENYGEAGSINHYGTKFGLPGATSGISSYYYWGPGNPNATTVIFVNYPEDYLNRFFSEVKAMQVIKNQYGINNEEQGVHIALCRKPNKPISELWTEWKHY